METVVLGSRVFLNLEREDIYDQRTVNYLRPQTGLWAQLFQCPP